MKTNSKPKNQNLQANNSSVTGSKGGSSSVTSMEELMKKSAAKFTPLRKGEQVEGTITKLTSQEILVDLGGKAEAIVLEKDKKLLHSLLTTLHIGDTVTVQVLNPESDMGYPVVSLRRFMDEGMWESLDKLQKDNKKLTVTVTEATKGGFVVETVDGLSGFLPNSHASFTQNAQNLVGKTLEVLLVEVNKNTRKVIFSQKAATTAEDFLQITQSLKVGDIVTATITNVASFGLFISLDVNGIPVDGFVHISEVSWENVTNLEIMYQAGQTIEVKVLSVDAEAKRVNLSIKQLTQDPFTEQTQHLSVDQKVEGRIARIEDGIIYIKLGEIEGIIPKDKVPVGINYEAGQPLTVTISEIDTRRRRVLVSPVLLRKTIGYR